MTLMTIIYIVFVIAAFSLCYVAVSRLELPSQVKTVLLLLLGLLGLAILWSLISGGGHLTLRGP